MSKWQGTPVPNTGYVENVYFNTALSSEEIDNICSQLTLNYDSCGNVILITPDFSKSFAIFNLEVLEMGVGYAIGDVELTEFYYISEKNIGKDVPFVGWADSFNSVISINSEVLSSGGSEFLVEFGLENDKLSSLFSITPFVEVQEKVTLNSFLTGIADAIRSKKGTTEPINASNFASEIESIESGDNTLKNLLDSTKTTYYLFNGYSGDNLSDLIKYNDTENVTNFYCMFYKCSSATSFPQLDTSKGTNFSNMFSDCSSATSFPQLDTSKGTDFGSMFYVCSSATSFPQLDTSKGTKFGNMYNGCSSATSFPAIDTSNATSTFNMYMNCSSATSFPAIDTSNATSLSRMYKDCRKTKLIDISKYNISSTSNSDSWCYNCYSLKAIIIRSFGSSYTLNSNAFNYCYHILGTTNSTYNPNGDKDGYIYVPRNMIETLSSATNWSKHATQFRALEDYTKDGTTTGEFDDEKAGLV